MSKKVKKLQRECERYWKEYCYLRDGKRCLVQAHFPEIKTRHTNTYQVDHMIERNFKRLFLEVANGTVICSACNSNKRYNSAVRNAIEKIRRRTEGDDVIDLLFEQRAQGGAFREWSRVWWLEDKLKVLKEIVNERTRN